MDEKLAVLRSVPLFVGLDDSELKAVGGLTTEVDVPAGHELAREETFGDEFYMILDGNVRIHRAGSTIRTLGPGDFLGEIALIDHGRRTASATAENGVCSAGFSTMAQPAASAGPALRVIIAIGKFHGVMAATTPMGWRMTRMRLSR